MNLSYALYMASSMTYFYGSLIPTLLLSLTVNRMTLGRNLGIAEMRLLPDEDKIYILNVNGREHYA